MKKIRSNVKHILTDKHSIAMIVIGMVIFVLTLIQNCWTQFVSDDWCYLFFYDHVGNPGETSRRLVDPFDVIVSMKNHWKMWNGRVVAHGLLQLVLSTSYPGFHKVIFNIVNSLMYVGLGALIYTHGTYQRKQSPLLLLGIYAMMWFYLPQYGATVLWASGAANYLWPAVIILAYLLPYRMYLVNSKGCMRDTWQNTVRMGIFGLFAGCTNENSGGALALMCILFVIAYAVKKVKIPVWSLTGIGSTIIGAVVLLIAPGNRRISSKATWDELLVRAEDVIRISKNILFPLLLIFAIVLFMVWITNMKKRNPQVSGEGELSPIIYLIGGVAAITVMIFSAKRPERTWFISVCLFIAVISYLYNEINFQVLKKYTTGIVFAFVVVTYLYSVTNNFGALHDTYLKNKSMAAPIYEAIDNGNSHVEVPLVSKPTNKYDSRTYVNGLGEKESDWQNAWAALYFGLDGISGRYEEEQQ